MKNLFNKKVLFVIVLSLCTILFSACLGSVIAYNHYDFDFNQDIKNFDFVEIDFGVATFNVQGGLLTHDKARQIQQILTNYDVDIAGLQEVDHFSTRTSKQDFMSTFTQSAFPNGYYAPINLQSMGDTYGLSAISKTKFDNTISFLHPYPFVNEKGSVEKRIIIRVLTTIGGVQIAFYNTHLSFENVADKNGQPIRTAQIKFICELLQKDPAPYKIVVGDFNVDSYDEYSAFIEQGYNIVNSSQNPYDTYRNNDYFNGIDNIIYSNNLQLLSSQMHDSDISDHNSLIAKFRTMSI